MSILIRDESIGTIADINAPIAATDSGITVRDAADGTSASSPNHADEEPVQVVINTFM
ncbi:unnamed protein product [Gongylonema pulchrum]|uniref:Uncharacterized protein n=1 Tax=Gongylonema pulchrum TaxID=637853 RepID=A0A3P6UJR1_9BILA|nr:unnamed protein product [Gongylonema pulchrum]